MSTGKARLFTLGSWAPSLQTTLRSTYAPCGCQVGVYLDWRGQIVSVIDEANPRCPGGHREGELIDDESESTPAPAERH